MTISILPSSYFLITFKILAVHPTFFIVFPSENFAQDEGVTIVEDTIAVEGELFEIEDYMASPEKAKNQNFSDIEFTGFLHNSLIEASTFQLRLVYNFCQ